MNGQLLDVTYNLGYILQNFHNIRFQEWIWIDAMTRRRPWKCNECGPSINKQHGFWRGLEIAIVTLRRLHYQLQRSFTPAKKSWKRLRPFELLQQPWEVQVNASELRHPVHPTTATIRLPAYFRSKRGKLLSKACLKKIQYFSNHFFENLVSSPEFLSACASKLIVYSKNMKTAYYWDSTSCFRIQYGHGSGSSKNFNLLERWCLSERTEAFLLKTWSAPGRLSTCIIGSCSKPLAVHLPSGAFGSSKRKPRDPWRPCYSSQVFSIVIGRHEAFSSCFEPQVFLKLQIHGTASLHFRNFQRSNRTSDLPRLL